jgi:NADH-quinone oxidoreductase subunit A
MDGLQLSEFGKALLFVLGGFVFAAGALIVPSLIAPRRPNPEKLTSYECGEEPEGSAWVRFNVRFYVMGLMFLVFDVELLVLFPWAVVYADQALLAAAPGWGLFALIEAFVFIAILAIGLAWIWQRGDIDWIRPTPRTTVIQTAIPDSAYAEYNIIK